MFFLVFFASVVGSEEPWLHHIPKTAGTSARFQLNELGNWHIKHTECCFRLASKRRPVVTFIRNPVDHVMSQFLECKYDSWGLKVTEKTKFPRRSNDKEDFLSWLLHFEDNDKDDFNCYNPVNMQTRSFSPTCTTSHHFASVDDNIFNRALNAMLSVEAIGITHEYKLSICVIMFKLTKVLPQMCDCNQVFKQYNITHGVPYHNSLGLSSDARRLIEKYTKYDEKLYVAALQRFWEDVHYVEKTVGKSLKCMYSIQK